MKLSISPSFFAWRTLSASFFGVLIHDQIKYSLTSSGKVIKRINPERVTALRRKLKKLAIKVQNGEIPYENVENAFKGWMGSFYKLLSKQQRVNLITLYEELFDKSITILNKKMIITDNAKKCL